jgi:hypothetical protein
VDECKALILGGKYDLAQEMCKKCLKYNKSCAKAGPRGSCLPRG